MKGVKPLHYSVLLTVQAGGDHRRVIPRQLRVQYPGAMCHVMSRGNRREDIPARAGQLQPEERLLAYPWSSLAYYLAAPEHRPQRVRVDRLLGEHGLQHDTPASQQEFERRLEARRLEAGDEQSLKALRRGWRLGSEDFKRRMLEETESQLGEHYFGELRQETAEAKAQRIVSEELGRLGWRQTDLASPRKSNPLKLQIAARLRRETTLSIKQIAERLHLGATRSPSVRLHTAMRQPASAQPAQGHPGM